MNDITPSPTQAKGAKPPNTAALSSFMKLWWEKRCATLVHYDPELLVLHSLENACGQHAWGTVFYSKAREEYKARVGSLPESRWTTFDLELMSRLKIAVSGGLVVAANPNSIVPGHLVVYPQEQRVDLNFEDICDMCRLASEQTMWTFIHNMEDSAASIVDWAHFQAYPWKFPLSDEVGVVIYESSGLQLIRLSETYPAYALMIESANQQLLAGWLFHMLGALAAGSEASTGKRIPCNLIWYGTRAWLIPRSRWQTRLAAKYIGALEMGGLFCLPSADSLRQYLPDALRAEVRNASIVDAPEMRKWCEQTARNISARLCSSQNNE